MQLDPQMPEAPLNLGILLLNEEPAAAVAPLQRAVELLPAQSRPRTLLGLAYLKSGDLKNSEDAFEGALALDPQDTETILHLAQLYLQQNRPLDARRSFARQLRTIRSLRRHSPDLLQRWKLRKTGSRRRLPPIFAGLSRGFGGSRTSGASVDRQR